MEKDKGMSAFWRIMSYVWPQWPRVAGVIFGAILLSIMFAVSLMTVLPLLKVMMNEEGLHGWVDRKVCNYRYGMDFYVPEMSDFQSENRERDLAYFLRIRKIDADSWADEAGLKIDDKIIGVGNLQPNSNSSSLEARIVSSKLLEELATTETAEPIVIRVMRDDATGRSEEVSLTAVPTAKEDYVDWMQWPVSFLPREQTSYTKMKGVILIIFGMSFVTILRCAGRFCQQYMAEKIVLVSLTHIREDIFKHAMHMPIGFFSKKGTSDTTSRLMHDVSQCGTGIQTLLGQALREPLKAVGTLAAALILNWQLTIIFIGAAPFTIGAFAILGRKIKKASKRSYQTSAEMLGRIQGAMGALPVVKVYNRQDHEIEKYHQTNQALLKRLLKVVKINTLTNPLMEVLGMIAGSIALVFGAVWVSKGDLDGSAFLTILVMLGTSAESIRKASNVWNNIQTANAAAERVFGVLDEPAEKEEPDARELKPLRDEIVFKDIVFTYPQAQSPALNGIDLTVKAGQTIAVVGPNGSGKSTLVNLIPRFYDPDSGQIFIDGQDIHRATLKSLRAQMSMVTQQVVTFNDTIASNIAYGKPGATLDEIIHAAKQAYAHEFIEPLPEGYQTMIGEHSAGFSGGQLQRIVIARAILKNPAILIFDEAMSQIDADSEMKIHQALALLMEGRTCFLIAHRFSTVISADSIVVIESGRVIAQGKHEELIATCDTYKRLYETQLIDSGN